MGEHMEDWGINTILYVDGGLTDSNTYLLINWGSTISTKIDDWVATLHTEVPNTDGTIIPMCEYNLDNLK